MHLIKKIYLLNVKLNIAKSTLGPPEWALILDNGGYTVQPVPAPVSIKTRKY